MFTFSHLYELVFCWNVENDLSVLLEKTFFNKKSSNNKNLNDIVFCHISFFNSDVTKLAEIEFVRHQNKDYLYTEEDSNKLTITCRCYVYFISLNDGSYLSLHRMYWSYFLWGSFINVDFTNEKHISKNSFLVKREVDLLKYEQTKGFYEELNIDLKHIYFLIDMYRSYQLLKKIKD